MIVKAKKHLGQHFLTSDKIAFDIASTLPDMGVMHVLEVGPGMGILTQALLKIYDNKLRVWI